jgi:hypothetical protein
VMVCSFLSEVTTPCKIRLGMARSSVCRRVRGFLGQNRLDAGNVTTDGTHAGGVFDLARGLLKAQIERFLLEREQLITQLVRRLVFHFLRFHALFLFSIISGPLKLRRVTS